MKQCWPEGALRAYLDGELPPQEMQAVESHLEECAECGRLHLELATRASHISTLFESLAEPLQANRRRPAPKPVHVAGSWRWTAAAVALAAGLAIAAYVVPKREAQRQPIAQAPVIQPVAPVITPAENVPVPVPGRRVNLASAKTRRNPPQVEHFIALDDEPIESGIVMRVTIPGSSPADIVFSPDGRARAIRLVNGTQQKY